MPNSSDPRILVLGAGSAGTRHARNLLALGARVAVADTDPARAASVEGAGAVEAVPADPDTLSGYDGVVVATPTAFHREHTLAALGTGAAVLVEKPLASTTAGLDELVEAAGGRVTVGYNLRLHRPVERLRERLAGGAVGAVRSVRLWFGSWLPDWRPGTDYRAGYSARSELGGGILLDASHEVDLLVWLFGREWVVEHAVMERTSTLEIDVEDTVEARLVSPAGTVAILDLDCVSPTYRRGIEVVGDAGAICLDWAAGTLETTSNGETDVEEASDPVDDSYRREAAAFLALVGGSAGAVVPASEAAVTVELCQRVRERAGWGAGPGR